MAAPWLWLADFAHAIAALIADASLRHHQRRQCHRNQSCLIRSIKRASGQLAPSFEHHIRVQIMPPGQSSDLRSWFEHLLRQLPLELPQAVRAAPAPAVLNATLQDTPHQNLMATILESGAIQRLDGARCTLTFLELKLHLMNTRPGVTPEAFLKELVKRWMATETGRQPAQDDGPVLRGFQWKTLFLPDGTILRTSHGDKVEFARVSGDHILSEDGTTLTPSLFANRRAKGRNAWRFVWLRFPDDECWIRADHCRLQRSTTKQSGNEVERSKTIHVDNASWSNPVHIFQGKGDFRLGQASILPIQIRLDRIGLF